MLFASLKEKGLTVEFIPEQARYYIATERLRQGLGEKLELNSSDQLSIMRQQNYFEDLMLKSSGDASIVITDSSALNAMLYLEEKYWNFDDVQAALQVCRWNLGVVFRCDPVFSKGYGAQDPNRIHNVREAIEVHKRLPGIIEKHIPGHRVVSLFGNTEFRCRVAVSEVMIRYLESST
jgi:hypothetical protein